MTKLQQVFSQAYDQYVEKIYRFVFLKVNSPEIAEDLTSETFVKGWQAFQQKSQENPVNQIENLQAFLYQIARNLVTDFYREKGAVNPVSIENCKEMADPQANLEEKVAVLSDMDIVKTALTVLKDDYQNVIIWHYLNDLSIKEVAKMLDRTEDATRVLLHRALKTLREAINRNEA